MEKKGYNYKQLDLFTNKISKICHTEKVTANTQNIEEKQKEDQKENVQGENEQVEHIPSPEAVSAFKNLTCPQKKKWQKMYKDKLKWNPESKGLMVYSSKTGAKLFIDKKILDVNIH